MRSDTKFQIWVAIWVIAIILFVVGSIKGEKVKKEMRPDTYQAVRFQQYNNL